VAFMMSVITRHVRLGFVPAAAVAFGLLGPAAAHASSIVLAQSVIASSGSSGNGLDIELTNSGASAVTIGGFSFGISIANADISFTDANTSTSASYIFGTDSLFGPDLTGPTSGQSLSTSDLFDIFFAGVTLNPGTTVGLGHVLFDVAPGAASGSFAVQLAFFPTTSLSDESGNNIAIDTLSNGLITITTPAAPVVPEPSSFSLLFSGVVASAVMMVRRRKPGGAAAAARSLQGQRATFPPHGGSEADCSRH
jgi:hypothetical protein